MFQNDSDDEQCALSDKWQYERKSRRWSRVVEITPQAQRRLQVSTILVYVLRVLHKFNVIIIFTKVIPNLAIIVRSENAILEKNVKSVT